MSNNTTKIEQKFSKLAIASFLCFIIAALQLIVTIVAYAYPRSSAYFFVSGPIGRMIFYYLMVWDFGFYGFNPIIVLFSILTIIFGIIANIKIRKNPNLKGRKLSFFAFLMGIFMLLFYIYMLFGWGIMRI